MIIRGFQYRELKAAMEKTYYRNIGNTLLCTCGGCQFLWKFVNIQGLKFQMFFFFPYRKCHSNHDNYTKTSFRDHNNHRTRFFIFKLIWTFGFLGRKKKRTLHIKLSILKEQQLSKMVIHSALQRKAHLAFIEMSSRFYQDGALKAGGRRRWWGGRRWEGEHKRKIAPLWRESLRSRLQRTPLIRCLWWKWFILLSLFVKYLSSSQDTLL